MSLPDTEETLSDGNLGFSAGNSDDVWAVVGAASAGTVGTVYQFSNPNDVVSTIGHGQAAELVTHLLEASGGSVLFTRPEVTASSPPVITQPDGGLDPVVGSTGAPVDAFEGTVEIVDAGTLGVATFKLSLDGEDNYSPVIATAASYTVPNAGFALTFAAGNYVAGKKYTFTTKAPAFSILQLNAAIEVLKADPRDFDVLHVCGVPDGADDAAKCAATAALVAAVQTKLETLFEEHIFVHAILDGPDIANDATGDTTFIAAMASVVAPKVSLVADFCELRSYLTSRVYRRPAAWAMSSRVKRAPISQDPGEVGNNGVGRLASSITAIRRDEARRTALNAQRLGTLRTFRRKPGFFATKCPTLAAPGSDFKYIQHARIINKACKVTREAMIDELNKARRTNPDGTILEFEARTLESMFNEKLRAELVKPNHAQTVEARFVRDTDILSSEQLDVDVSVLPFAYPSKIRSRIGFAKLVARS